MKVDIQKNQNLEKNKNDVQLQAGDEEMLTASNLPFSNVLSLQMQENKLNEDYINNVSMMPIDFNYSSMEIDLKDALFFVDLVKEGQFTIETAPNGDFQSVLQLDIAQNVVSQRTVEVTNQLTSLIEQAQKTQKPVRISFDNDVSVILKIDKHGKVSAEFIPGSLEVENYLKNNIALLKQRFDEQNLPYNDLFYRQNSKQNRNKNNRNNKGE